MTKRREIPSFACEETHELELGGRKLTFYAVSGPVLLRVQKHLGGAFAKALAALAAGGGEALQGALADLLAAIGEHPQAVGLLILDALHDEDWNERPPSPAMVDQFLQQTSGQTLVAMLAGVAAVNAKAFAPFAGRLSASVREATAGEQKAPQETSPESSS